MREILLHCVNVCLRLFASLFVLAGTVAPLPSVCVCVCRRHSSSILQQLLLWSTLNKSYLTTVSEDITAQH